MIAEIIGAGASLLGGLFGNSAKKKQQKAELAARAEDRKWFLEDRDNERGYARGAYDRLVADSEAAGFNPLTALRAGGAPGSTSNASPFLSTQTLTGGGSSPLGDSLQNVGNIIANFDPFEDKLREQQFQVQQAQLRSLELSNTAAAKKMFDVPAASGRRVVASGPSVGPSATLRDMSGVAINVGPGSAAEDWEAEYGEIAGELEGLPRYLRDRVKPALLNPATYGWPWINVDTSPRKADRYRAPPAFRPGFTFKNPSSR